MPLSKECEVCRSCRDVSCRVVTSCVVSFRVVSFSVVSGCQEGRHFLAELECAQHDIEHFNQAGMRTGLVNICRRVTHQRAMEVFTPVRVGQNNDGGRGANFSTDLSQKFQSIHPGHINIADDQICFGGCFRQPANCVLTVNGAVDAFNAGILN